LDIRPDLVVASTVTVFPFRRPFESATWKTCFKQTMRIAFDEELSNGNYTA